MPEFQGICHSRSGRAFKFVAELTADERGYAWTVNVYDRPGRVPLRLAGHVDCKEEPEVTAIALRRFGGMDQTPGIRDIPLETFVDDIDELQQQGCKRIAMIGTSKGAEAALLTATLDAPVPAVSPLGRPLSFGVTLGLALTEFLSQSDHHVLERRSSSICAR